MLKEKCDIQHAIKQGCSCVPCVFCSVMPKPKTGTILCWRSSPCGGCGGRKGESELLDDMDFDKYGKVKCREIEQMLPKLMKMLEGEIESMIHGE